MWAEKDMYQNVHVLLPNTVHGSNQPHTILQGSHLGSGELFEQDLSEGVPDIYYSTTPYGTPTAEVLVSKSFST